MKYILAFAGIVLSASSAHADFNTDSALKAVRCKAPQTTVVINAARTEIQVTDATDPGHPETYKVSKRNSDGDTFASYSAANITESKDTLELSFDDRGDSLTFAGQKSISLKCPQ